jgi:hypothetical protein
MKHSAQPKKKITCISQVMLDMKRLKIDREYFLDKVEKNRIGISYVFTSEQKNWLIAQFGLEWQKKFVRNNIISLLDSRFHIGSSLKGFINV